VSPGEECMNFSILFIQKQSNKNNLHMEKIIIQALKSKFDNAELIAKVANATRNPQVAVEMLLGIYTPMTPDEFGMVRKDKYYDKYYVVKEIKELEDIIVCNVYSQKTITAWYKTKEDYNTDSNRIYDRLSDYYTTREVSTKGFTTQSDVVFTIEEIKKHKLATGVDLGLFMEACENTIDPLAKPVVEYYDGSDATSYQHEDIFN